MQLPLIDLNYSYFSKEYDSMIKDVRKFYFGDKPVDANSLQEFVKLLSDVFFIYGIDKSVKAQAKRSTGKTFYYQWVFLYLPFFSLSRIPSILFVMMPIFFSRQTVQLKMRNIFFVSKF